MAKIIRFKTRAFTLIEVLLAIILLSLVGIGSVSVVDRFMDQDRFESTISEMDKIREACIGNANQTEGGKRTSFGFLGDIGAIPTAAQGIAGLITNPTLPAWANSAAVRIGLGWNGPYLSAGDSDADFTRDAWGTAYLYCPAVATPMIRSCGGNATCGGAGTCADAADADDITYEMPAEKTTATVYGFISDNNGPFTALAEAEINYPDGTGVLTQVQDPVTVAEAGRFQFNNIPFGVRSITVYVPSKAAPVTTIGPVIVTIDQPNILIPSNWIDINP